MKVTKIEKKKRLYLIEIEDESLYVTEDTIVHFMMTKGMEITKKQLEEIRQFAQFSYGKNLALYYLSFKKRTTKEVEDYLIKYEIDEKQIPVILKNLKKDNWINDETYTRQYIDSNLITGNKGPYILKQKLAQKGIPATTIDPILEETDFKPLLTSLTQKLVKKYQSKLPTSALESKIVQFLTSKGFTYQDSKEAIKHFTIEQDSDLEQDLLQKELDKQ